MELAVIADEITALGWRLAGARVQTPEREAVSESFGAALARADLVLITAGLAARVPTAQLEQALHATKPLVLLIPDLRHLVEPPDIEQEVRRALGVAA